MKRTRLLLLLWLFGILFPVAWLGRISPGFGQVFDAVFAPEWMHWLMHAALFAGLVILSMTGLNLPPSWRSAGLMLGLVLLVGLLQESSQLLSGVQVLHWNSLLDLGVDLLGAGLGLLGVWLFRCLTVPEMVR